MKPDIVDQYHAVQRGELSRRAFNKTLLGAGLVTSFLPAMPRRPMAQGSGIATYFTWGGYDIPELFDDFVAQHGELPNFALFGSVEDALTRFRAGFVADLVHPCMSDVPRWTESGLFQPIDPSRLSNFPDVLTELYDADFNQAEGGGIWQVPFDWGDTSITFRTDLYEFEGEDSWDILWDESLAGRIGMLGAGDDAWWCGAIKAGVPFSELHTDEAFDTIAAVMRQQRPLVRMYTDDTTTLNQALASGELVAAMTWNSSATELAAEGLPVRFARPKEGTLTWICGVMMHRDAPNPDNAYDIIDSLISVSAGQFMINDYGYGHANARSFELFTDEELAARSLSRDPAALLDAGHRAIPQSQEWTARMNTLWEQIKAGF